MNKSIVLPFLLGLPVILGCSEKKTPQLANPASVNCIEKGGTLQITKRGDGGEYGVCFFEDNRQCEEWALFYGNCPVGGIKVTGYTTPQAVYCAIKGGEVSSDEKECTLPSGKTCSMDTLYNGTCVSP